MNRVFLLQFKRFVSKRVCSIKKFFFVIIFVFLCFCCFRFWKISWRIPWEKELHRRRLWPPWRCTRPSCDSIPASRSEGRPEEPSSTCRPASSCVAGRTRSLRERSRPERPGRIGGIPGSGWRPCEMFRWRICGKKSETGGPNPEKRKTF